MCLVGRPNPYKLEQSWELTFLIGLTLLNTKLALKKFLTHILKRYGHFTIKGVFSKPSENHIVGQ